MRVFILTGEPSGDLHGAHLARALSNLDPGVELLGVGGVRMRAAQVHLVAESSHWGAIGIPDTLRKVPRMLVEMGRLERLLRADPPDVLVPIDFGTFNVTLLKRLHGSGIRTVYFIPPGCWSRDRAAGRLPFLVDGVATPFPWSADNLRAAGAPARIEWVGHPILDYTRVTTTREEARRRLGIDPARPVIAMVPGSRRSELRYLLPVFVETLQRLTPAPQVLITVAPNLGDEAIRRLLPDGMDVRLLHGIDYELIQAADAALVTSGTATLEMVCLNLPMMVAYRGSFATWVQYRIMARGGRLRFISLPNIIMERMIVPERLQHAADPEIMAADITALLTDQSIRQAQLDAFSKIRAMLGDGHAIERTAALVREVGMRTAAVGVQVQ